MYRVLPEKAKPESVFRLRSPEIDSIPKRLKRLQIRALKSELMKQISEVKEKPFTSSSLNISLAAERG